MSQNDFNIANQGFPSFRSDLNGALQALASNSAGTSAPATTYAYMWWYDSTNDILKMRNADNDAWIDFASFDQATDTWSFASVVIDGDLTVDTDTLVVDSTNNRVGINEASPLNPLDVVETDTTAEAGTVASFRTGAGGYFYIQASDKSVANPTWNIGAATNEELAFYASNAERMRIDSSGNVLVGTTDASLYNNGAGGAVGVGLNPSGYLQVARSNANPLLANRLDSDGAIADFRKDGTTVGSIGVSSGRNYIASDNGSTGCGVIFGTNGMFPTNRLGASTDNTYDVGAITARWDDVYATNGLIQTSDANEKQQIAELTAAEMQAAKAISKLFKTFKWNDSVTEKGDDARIHSGVIAQEVEAAMTDAGLDAGKYAFFISSTWWESTEVIPAVEEVLDEEGNVVTEAQAERTVTHQHDTAEEAPEGAVERNRKGIRYPQLLAFVGAATEQRLASIEARLDAAGL